MEQPTEITNYGTPFMGFRKYPKPPFDPVVLGTGNYTTILGPLIRAERIRLNWTQADLGLRVRCDRRTIAAAERNPGQVSFATMLDILACLDINVYLKHHYDHRSFK